MIESLLAFGLRSVGDDRLRAGDVYTDERCLVCRGIASQLLLPQFQVACISRNWKLLSVKFSHGCCIVKDRAKLAARPRSCFPQVVSDYWVSHGAFFLRN